MSCAETETYTTTGSLGYLKWIDLYRTEKPYVCTLEPWHTPGALPNNLSVSSHDVVVKDMRPNIKDFSTDVHGFQMEVFPSKLSNDELQDKEIVKAKYCREVEEFLKERFGAKRVGIFDQTFRRVGKEEMDPAKSLRGQQVLGAAVDVHVDQTPESVRRRVEECFPRETEQIFKEHRVRVMNIWRPLFTPLQDHPLAMCDYRSTSRSEYVGCDIPSPCCEGEAYLLTHNPKHDWWFVKEMQENEVLCLKIFDSAAEVPGSSVALCTPHTSFQWADTPKNARKRESIEIRAIFLS